VSEYFCIYCHRENLVNPSKAHIFPQSIGGRVYLRHCCDECNSTFGSHFEGDIMRCLFFTFGMAKTGLKTNEDAFRSIPIIDPATGERYQYDGDEIVGSPKVRSDGTRIAPKRILRKQALKDVEERFPEKLEEYRKQLDNGASEIRIGDEVQTFRKEHLKGPVNFVGQTVFPYAVLAKITYEVVFFASAFHSKLFKDFRNSVFTVNPDLTGEGRIRVADSFLGRVRPGYPDVLRNPNSYSTLEYKRYHYVDYRLSARNVAFVKINFFGQQTFMVVLGELGELPNLNPEVLTQRVIFPIEGQVLALSNYPDEYSTAMRADAAFADIVWDTFTGKLTLPPQKAPNEPQ